MWLSPQRDGTGAAATVTLRLPRVVTVAAIRLYNYNARSVRLLLHAASLLLPPPVPSLFFSLHFLPHLAPDPAAGCIRRAVRGA